jgi:hypothetical protein
MIWIVTTLAVILGVAVITTVRDLVLAARQKD